MPPQNLTRPSSEEHRKDGQKMETNYQGRIFLTNPAKGEEVVITGMAGRFPASDDIYEYQNNLMNKKDMTSTDNRRWDPIYPDIPYRTGKIGHIEKFDAGFFGIHYRQAQQMDPNTRQVLERTVEAIMDAGYHPEELRGSKTGVFVGNSFAESEKTWFYEKLESPTFGLTGCSRSMQAHWISHFLGLEGPSQIIDTACSGSLFALEHAFRAIRMGRCKNAIVAGTNLCLQPTLSFQLARLGVLSLDGSCNPFDEDANGYIRAEAMPVIFLQTSKDARRIYAQIVHAKTNTNGFIEEGISFPSYRMQKQLMEELYQECNVDPNSIDFFEAHSTGTRAGDPQELMAIDDVFCTHRKTPLCVGSVKSNMGHTEPSSGLCSVIKILIGMENNCLIPNINYTKPRKGVEALEKGRMVVLTELIPWPKDCSGLAAVNSFGFGGTNSHVLLKRWSKEKTNGGLPKDDLPRVVCVSGRTESAIRFILDDISNRTLDEEYIRLLHETFKNEITGHVVRGYMVMSKSGELKRSFQYFDGVKQPLCFIFGGSNENWLSASKELVNVPLFTTTIQRMNKILSSKGINLVKILTEGIYKNVVESVLGNVAIQISLVNILRSLELTPDYIDGYGSGVLAAGYADGVLTLEQAVISAYYYGWKMQNIKYNKTSKPVNLADDLIAVSGPNCKIINDKLEHVHSVPSNDLEQIRPELLKQLKSVIINPKKCLTKWVSSTNKSVTFSADHLVNKLLCPTITNLPSKSVMLGIGSVFVKLKNENFINLISANQVNSFLYGLGCLYNLGYNLKLHKLYPEIQCPVSCGTPMISPLIKWNHAQDWFVARYKPGKQMKSAERHQLFFINDNDSAFISGHVIDRTNIMPGAAFIFMVWDTLSQMMGVVQFNLQVVFENVKYLRATIIPSNQSLSFCIMIQRSTGQFEVRESGQVVVTGRIYAANYTSSETSNVPLPAEDNYSLTLTNKDIYKELKLRGYNFAGIFRSLKSCDLTACKGLAEWKNNWVAFMDSMCQLQLLQYDSRSIEVGSSIDRLTIDPQGHMEYVKTFGENPTIPIYVYKELNLIRSGGIEFRGVYTKSISRRKPLNNPVLLTYKFIPFETELSVEQSVRVCIQLLSENNNAINLRIVEDMSDATKMNPLGPIIQQAFCEVPFLQPEIVVLSKNSLKLTDVKVEDKKLSSENKSCALVIVSRIISHQEKKQQVLDALEVNGMIISREDLNLKVSTMEGFHTLAALQTDKEKIILLRKSVESKASITVIDISKHLNFDWLSTLKAAMNNHKNILILSQNEPCNGILGLVSCLRHEPGGLNVRCVFVLDKNAPSFDLDNKFYSKQLAKGLTKNIYKNGKWGTYRYLSLEKNLLVQREHVFNNVTARGDLSSLRWIEGPLTTKSILPPDTNLVHIACVSLNIMDIMTASGRLSTDHITKNRLEQYNVQGYEYSGRTSSGRRVMGMVNSGALASMIKSDTYLTWDIPDEWSMEQAATIPVAYCAVLFAFVGVIDLKPGQSILIHAGSEGVAQAAINIAMYYKFQIFTTVETEEKRDFIRKTFPEIHESHIGKSQDTSFEQMILRETNGRGVDVVLNSLSKEKLQASIRCLAPYGKFLEIGKLDLDNNNPMGLKLLNQGRSFHGITLNAVFDAPSFKKKRLSDLLTEGLAKGMIKPLHQAIFRKNKVEQAFRYMAEGQRIGKVTIKLREDDSISKTKLFKGIPRFYGNPDRCYVICGGLGGFGLELADWIVTRGGRNLVLVSRSGVTTGYQASRIRIWKSYGVNVEVSSADITKKEGCVALINDAARLGPIEGIFNSALVLKDALIENQNEASFLASLGPKATATQHLDLVSRELCPELRYFVVCSSIISGRGNIGQTNYGMANSIMERICEKRKSDGLPGLAIQWASIGDVGVMTEMQEPETEIELCGTLQQKIASCLEVLDTFLSQSEPIVSSMVVAEKKNGNVVAASMLDTVKNILGLQQLKSISLYSPLSELGMDSMMAIEIRQTLEREFAVFLTAQEIRSATFAKLIAISEEKETGNATLNKEQENELMEGINLLLEPLSGEQNSTAPILKMLSLVNNKSVQPKVFLLPGIEGMAPIMETVSAYLAAHAVCLQYPYTNQPETGVEELAKLLHARIKANLQQNTSFNIIAYSYGAIIALEVASLLEAEGYIGSIILIDGAPAMFREVVEENKREAESEALLQTNILCALMQHYIPRQTVLESKDAIYNCKTFEERVGMVIKLAGEDSPYSESYQRQICVTAYSRIKSVLVYKPKFVKLKSLVKLFKPSQPTFKNFGEAYGIQDLCEYPVEVSIFEGNHLTIMKNPQIGFSINKIIDTSRNSATGQFVAESLSSRTCYKDNH